MSDTPGNPAPIRADIATVETDANTTHTEVAAAPLGTDSEAAGTPPTKGEVQQAKAEEPKPAHKDPSRTQSVTAEPYGLPILLAAATAVVMGGILWVLLT